jgi:hypothetical protein
MISCTLYTRARTLYIFFRDSSKCSECTRKGVIYNRNFSKADFNKLSKEKDRLKATRTCAITEIASLDKRIKAL